MKKTLLACALGLASFAANAADGDSLTETPVTWSVTSTNCVANGNGNYNGIAFSFSDLNCGRYSATSTPRGETMTDHQVLTEISITWGSGDGTTHTDNARLVLTTASGLILGVSSTGTSSSGADTFSFADSLVILSKPENYRVYFTESEASDITLGGNISSVTTVARRLKAGNCSSGGNAVGEPTSLGFLSTSGELMGVTSDDTDNAKWIPYVTITTSNTNLPEPTTATLSLLALAGLAARRRRK